MLARLLRRALFAQWFLGAALGIGLYKGLQLASWAALALALVFPMVVTALGIVFTAVVSRPGESVRAWWCALLGEILATWHIYLLRQPWTRGLPPLLAGQGAARVPVVLVHGYMCNHRLWDTVAARLRARGHTVQAVNLEPLFTSIDHYAPIVEAAVQGLVAHTGAQRVALVGHSMGGLALRAWARRYGTARAARLISLGTPHVGTQVPQHLPSPNGRQMEWHSDWLQALARDEAAAGYGLWDIALTAHDNIVFPQRAQTLQGVQATVFDGIGHLQMCLHPPVIDWLLERLDHASPKG